MGEQPWEWGRIPSPKAVLLLVLCTQRRHWGLAQWQHLAMGSGWAGSLPCVPAEAADVCSEVLSAGRNCSRSSSHRTRSRVAGADLSALIPAGRKAGKGFYVYQEGVKNRSVNSGMDEILQKFRVPANPDV